MLTSRIFYKSFSSFPNILKIQSNSTIQKFKTPFSTFPTPTSFSTLEFQDPILLTPGPLTTSLSVKQASLHDLGSRDSNFLNVVRSIRESVLEISEVDPNQYTCVLLQGSGTFIVEASIGTLTPKTSSSGGILVLSNGNYGERIYSITQYLNRESVIETVEQDEIFTAEKVEKILQKLEKTNQKIDTVAIVQSETTSGLINPVEEIGEMVIKKYNKKFIIDAMSSFGVIHVDPVKCPYTSLIASSNKCLEGLPGVGFSIIRKDVLEKCKGNSHSLAMDLYEQNVYMNKNNNQWRFTPPTHVLLSFYQAIQEFKNEGGREGRYKRYKENSQTLLKGMKEMGFDCILDDEKQGPIIHTFLLPQNDNFEFERFYNLVKSKGFVLYPGKVTKVPSFRIGSIGRINSSHIKSALNAISQSLKEMDVKL